MRTLLFFIVILFILSPVAACSQKNPTYTKEDIIKDLEDLPPYKELPNFEHPYIHTAGNSRVILFADSTRWAIVFEKAGYGEGGGMLELTYFGNCLINQAKQGLYKQFLSNSSFFSVIEPKELAGIEAGTDSISYGLVSPSARQVKVRGSFLPIEQDPEKYARKGIAIQDYDNPRQLIDFPALVRYLAEEQPELFNATDEELRSLLPADLPKLLVIDKWHYRHYYVFPDGINPPYGEKPGSYETFPMVADILVSKDTTRWKPTLPPNNNWRYWPRAGQM